MEKNIELNQQSNNNSSVYQQNKLIDNQINESNSLNKRITKKKEIKKMNNNQTEINEILKNNEKLAKTKIAERQYRKLSSITTINSLLFFVKICVSLESNFLFYYAYNLLIGFNDITQFTVALIYLLDYIISLINIILYLKFIIQYNIEKKQKSKKINLLIKNNKCESTGNLFKRKTILGTKNSVFNKIGFNIDEDDENQQSIFYLVFLIYFRLITWFIKFILYLIVLKIVSKINFSEYLKVPILFVEYFLYNMLKFYIKVILRLKSIKKEFDLKIDEK